MPVDDRYHDNLSNPRQRGEGAYSWIMSTANLGTLAGLDGDQIHSDIQDAIPEGKRRISDHEITGTIRKAMQDRHGGTFTPRLRPELDVYEWKATLASKSLKILTFGMKSSQGVMDSIDREGGGNSAYPASPALKIRCYTLKLFNINRRRFIIREASPKRHRGIGSDPRKEASLNKVHVWVEKTRNKKLNTGGKTQ